MKKLPVQKRGRLLLLGEKLDGMLQPYLKKVCEAGGVVPSRIVIAAAKGLMMNVDRATLAEFGGYMSFSKAWAHSLLHRMGYVQRKATTSKSKITEVGFFESKQPFLSDVRAIVIMEEVPPELVLNWDQTGIKIVPIDTWTMELRGFKCVELIGLQDKRQITAVFCGTLVGDFLPVQLVYKGKTNRCHTHFAFLETAELQPISLNLPCLKELGAKWLVEAANYMSENPQMIISGFVKAGISSLLSADEDGTIDIQDSNEDEVDSDSESQFESDQCDE